MHNVLMRCVYFFFVARSHPHMLNFFIAAVVVVVEKSVYVRHVKMEKKKLEHFALAKLHSVQPIKQ